MRVQNKGHGSACTLLTAKYNYNKLAGTLQWHVLLHFHIVLKGAFKAAVVSCYHVNFSCQSVSFIEATNPIVS